ncbi:MAG: hypothetical protein KGL95_02545, partial [Patescibacteria group bacterium]|nr:hypothetical protein [Patescibacteria group bacterium]
TRYVLSGLAYNSFFSQAAMGRRAGSPLHLGTIFMIMRMQQKAFKFCIPDLGDRGVQRPDLLIFEPQRTEDQNKKTSYDPLYWSEKIIAVEVEIDPTKHESQLVENFRKNFELGYDIWFVVFSQKHKQYIMDTMNKSGVAKQFYNIVLVPPESVEHLSNVQNNSVANLTREELEVYNALKDGGTVPWIAEKTRFSSYDVMGILWKLEQKEVAERGYAETKKTEFDLASGKNITETKRKEYFIPTKEGKKLAESPQRSESVADNKAEILPNKESLVTENHKNVMEKPVLQEGLDLSVLSDRGLADIAPHQKYGSLAKKLLENRGYYVSIKNGKAKLRKKIRR